MVKKLTFLVFVFSLLPSLSFAYSVDFNTPDECVIKNHNFHIESEWYSLVASNDIYWKVCHDYIINSHIVDSKCSEWKNSVTKVAFGCDFSAREGDDQKVRTRLLKKVNDNQYLMDSEEASITVCRMSDYYTKEEVEQLIENELSYYYTKEEIIDIINNVEGRFSNYYPKDVINDMIEELQQQHYTKEEVTELLDDITEELGAEINEVEEQVGNLSAYIQQHEAEWKKDEVGGGISLHTVERWFKETWQSVIEWVESKVNWLLEKVSDLLEWRDEANTKLAELEARVRYLERVCEKLMETREQEKYEDIVAVMVENNLSELRVGDIVCTIENNRYTCVERVI